MLYKPTAQGNSSQQEKVKNFVYLIANKGHSSHLSFDSWHLGSQREDMCLSNYHWLEKSNSLKVE